MKIFQQKIELLPVCARIFLKAFGTKLSTSSYLRKTQVDPIRWYLCHKAYKYRCRRKWCSILDTNKHFLCYSFRDWNLSIPDNNWNILNSGYHNSSPTQVEKLIACFPFFTHPMKFDNTRWSSLWKIDHQLYTKNIKDVEVEWGSCDGFYLECRGSRRWWFME